MSVSERLLYWPILLAISLIFSYLVRATVKTMAPRQHQFSRDGLVIVLFSTLFAPMPSLVLAVLRGGQSEPALTFSDTYLLILIVASAVVIVRHLLNMEAGPTEDKIDERPRFLRRLEGSVCPEQVLRLTVDDHYVEVYLTTGKTQRILIRFADAVDEMDGLEGMCVHRSHWVASQAIRSVEKEGGREFVVLSDDSRVPVSRTYRPNLVEAGWIVDGRQKSAEPLVGAGLSARQRPLFRTKS